MRWVDVSFVGASNRRQIFTDWRQMPATSDALQAGGWRGYWKCAAANRTHTQ
jgi:hypothetical protein